MRRLQACRQMLRLSHAALRALAAASMVLLH
jgi:hypothetical protein